MADSSVTTPTPTNAVPVSSPVPTAPAASVQPQPSPSTVPAAPAVPAAPVPTPAPVTAALPTEQEIIATMAGEQMLRRQDELGAYVKQMESELKALQVQQSRPSVSAQPTQPLSGGELPDDIAADPLAQKIVGIERTVSSLAQSFQAQQEEAKQLRAEAQRAQERQRYELLRDSERRGALKWINDGVIKNDPELLQHPGAVEELRDFVNGWMDSKFDPSQDLQFQGRTLQLDTARRIGTLKQRFGLQQAPRQQALERNTALVNNPAVGGSGVSQVPAQPGAPAPAFKHPADSREGLKERFLAKAASLGFNVSNV